jgi:hypothetical protein
MATAYASGVIAADPDNVWQVARQFDGWSLWHPMIASSEMVGGADPHAVGARRRQVLEGGHVVHARLVALDDDRRSITYEMLDGHFPVRAYVSTIRVIPVTATGESFVEWWGTYDADAVDEAQLQVTFGEDVYAAGIRALASAFPDLRPEEP